MIDASDLYVGARVLIKTQEQYPFSSNWSTDSKWIFGEVATISFLNHPYFKVKGSSKYFPITIISSIIDDDNCEIETGSIDSFIDLI